MPHSASCMYGKALCSVSLLLSFTARAQNGPGARVTIAHGQVSITRDNQPWAISPGDSVEPQTVVTTGADGFARLELNGGSYFEVYADSRVAFRRNAGDAGDLVDVLKGRAKVHLQPALGQAQQRVFTPVAVVSAILPATIAVALDGNDMARIDVLEGEVRVQHKLLPRSEPTIVKAVDAILVEPDQQISRRLDRGTLYRYAIKLRDLINVLAPGHKAAQPVEQNQLFAMAGRR